MTGRWLTVSQTIRRIYTSTGRLLSANDVLTLGRRGDLVVNPTHEHTRVLESSVDAYEAEHRRPSVRGGAELPAHIEDEYERSKEDV